MVLDIIAISISSAQILQLIMFPSYLNKIKLHNKDLKTEIISQAIKSAFKGYNLIWKLKPSTFAWYPNRGFNLGVSRETVNSTLLSLQLISD